MSESPQNKTSRKLANLLEKYCFTYQATVFLSDENPEQNLQDIKKIKSLIKKDNPQSFMLSFISHSLNRVMREEQPYICFYSWDNLIGTSTRKAQADMDIRVAGERTDQPNRKFISRLLMIDQIDGTIKRIRKEKIFNLDIYFEELKFRRFSFLNEKHQPSQSELAALQKDHKEKQERLAARRPKKKM
ncbi:hypothetical protein H0A71_13895 [Alcaligenaceae bacterium]|nr:hypothetical protein [Alcaligenaceae bacterium]